MEAQAPAPRQQPVSTYYWQLEPPYTRRQHTTTKKKESFMPRTARFGAAALVVGSLGATVVGTAPTATAQASAAASAIQKLVANNAYPYTNLSIRVPRFSGVGTAKYAKLLTGLDLTVSSQKTSKPGGAGELSVSYAGVELGQFRFVGGNAYVLLDVSHWADLPVSWGASAKQGLGSLDLAFGERWFELPGTLVKRLEAKAGSSSSFSPVLGHAVTSPAALRQLSVQVVTKFIAGLDLTESPLPGGNDSFSAHGSLASLEGHFLSVARSLHVPGLPAQVSQAPRGTYSVVMATAGAGRYIARVDLGVQVQGKGALELAIAFAHAPEPVTAPQGATVVTPSMLAGMGL